MNTRNVQEAATAITNVCDELKHDLLHGTKVLDLLEIINELRDMLITKNAAYGNAVFDPLRVFSTASVEELIRVRIDDKISRIKRGQNAGEDSFNDWMGYLILLQVARRHEDAQKAPGSPQAA